MKAWQYESGTLTYNSEILDKIYINKNIKNFLEIGEHDHNLVLIGPKGVGKTLFLNLKSFLIRENYLSKGIKAYPIGSQLCENLMLDNNKLGKRELIRFSELSLWNKIWRLAISLIACKTLGMHIENRSLNELIITGFSFTSIITQILSDRSNLENYLACLPILTKKIETINAGICIFLDNVDQAFSQLLLEQHATDYHNLRENPSIKVWTNAQMGLMSAIYDLNRHNSHLKVYSSVRAESFKCISNEMQLNYESYTTFLKYTKSELKKIFEKNIILTSPQTFSEEEASNLIHRFLGIKKITHPIVKDKKGESIKEDIFDFIFRHTMGRPRELVLMGSYLYLHVVNEPDYHTLSKKEKTRRIRKATNKVSNKVINVYLSEIIPRFDKALLTEFIRFIQSNVIPAKHVLNNYFEVLEHYFSIGIVGFAQRDIESGKEDQYIQKFLPASEYSYKENIVLPNTKYFITHPCLDNFLKRTLDSSFYNPFNIIGNTYKFREKPGMTKIYDVALSYSSNERGYVEEVADYLIRKNIKVFYDKIDKRKLWGNNLEQYLEYVYKFSSRFCVLFISESYLSKRWTNFELQQALERYDSNNRKRYLLPVKFGNIEYENLQEIVHLNANEETPSELAELIEMSIEEDKLASLY